MDQEAELVGRCLAARGAVGGEVQLVRLDQVLGLAASAIDLLVKHLGQARQIGDDETTVGTLRSGLDAGDNAALNRPALGSVAEITIAADLLPFAIEAAQSGVFGQRTDLAPQHGVAREAEDVADPLALAPRHRLRPAVMAVATHHNVDRWPAGADVTNNMAQDQCHLGPVRRLAGPQDHSTRLAAGRLVDMDRQETTAVVVRIP